MFRGCIVNVDDVGEVRSLLYVARDILRRWPFDREVLDWVEAVAFAYGPEILTGIW